MNQKILFTAAITMTIFTLGCGPGFQAMESGGVVATPMQKLAMDTVVETNAELDAQQEGKSVDPSIAKNSVLNKEQMEARLTELKDKLEKEGRELPSITEMNEKHKKNLEELQQRLQADPKMAERVACMERVRKEQSPAIASLPKNPQGQRPSLQEVQAQLAQFREQVAQRRATFEAASLDCMGLSEEQKQEFQKRTSAIRAEIEEKMQTMELPSKFGKE